MLLSMTRGETKFSEELEDGFAIGREGRLRVMVD